MSEEKLQSLIDAYPNYKDIFREVFNWFKTHPKQRDVSLELFYLSKSFLNREQVSIAFVLMKQSSFLKSVYRIVDNDGTKIGEEITDLNNLPTYVDTSMGEKVHIDDVLIVPFYSLNI